MTKRDQNLSISECLSTSKTQSERSSIKQYSLQVSENHLEILENQDVSIAKIKFIDILTMVYTKQNDSYEIQLELYDKILEIQNIELENGKATLDVLACKIAQRNFSKKYQRLEIIKTINNGEIIKCKNIEDNKIYVAKIMSGNNFLTQRELQINKFLTLHPHENIASIIEYFCENNQIVLIFPFYQGGTLNQLIGNSFLQRQKKIAVKKIMKKILSGLNHIHSIGIIHRDIKMDNIMIEEPNDERSIKIIDFGFSAFKSNSSYVNEKCGTIGYFAPEIINGNYYDEKCDIYSLAQIFHVLLTGKPMFDRNLEKQQIIKLSKLNMFQINFGKIQCQKAANLLQTMLQKLEKRPNAIECLKHEYFQKFQSLEEKIKNMGSLCMKSPFNTTQVKQ